jgi:antitoxin MazE
MKTAIRKMGNSQGILIPKPFLMQTGLDVGEVEIQVQEDAIVIRKLRRSPREGWADACRALAAGHAEQPIVWPLLGTEKNADKDIGFSW